MMLLRGECTSYLYFGWKNSIVKSLKTGPCCLDYCEGLDFHWPGKFIHLILSSFRDCFLGKTIASFTS